MVRYVLILIVVFSIFNCSKLDKETNKLIEQKKDILLNESLNPIFLNQWAVIKYDLLKFRFEPTKDSKIINHLRKGKIVKIIKCKRDIDTFDNQKEHWYFVNYQGQNGWIFGSYLDIYNTYDEALEESKKMIYSEEGE